MKEVLSFWLAPDGDTVRVLYHSPASWEKTLMADIDLKEENVRQVSGNGENRYLISKFNLAIEDFHNPYRRLAYAGNDAAVINRAREVLENGGASCRLLKIHVKAALDYDYVYTDALHKSLDKIREEMNAVYRTESGGEGSEKDFFCGTTDDIDVKMEWHRIHDFDIAGNKVYAWVCAHTSHTERLKQWAAEVGYDITGEAAPAAIENPQKTTVIYLLKKGKSVNR